MRNGRRWETRRPFCVDLHLVLVCDRVRPDACGGTRDNMLAAMKAGFVMLSALANATPGNAEDHTLTL
jgi:hypothetical protein